MKTIDTKTITENVKRLCIEAATFIENDVLNRIKKCMENETGLSKSIMEQIIENDELASKKMFLCVKILVLQLYLLK